MKTSESQVFYDGNCPLCLQAVKFIRNHSEDGHFQFIPLQDARETRIPGIADMEADSLALIQNNQLYTESEAVLRLAGKLKFPWSLLKIFLFLPAKWRDAVYRSVARKRHLFFRSH